MLVTCNRALVVTYCATEGCLNFCFSRTSLRGNIFIRLVPTRAGVGAVSPGSGREAGDREAGRQRGAMDPSPGGSGRYRPAVARVGGESAASRRREWGGRRATRWLAEDEERRRHPERRPSRSPSSPAARARAEAATSSASPSSTSSSNRACRDARSRPNRAIFSASGRRRRGRFRRHPASLELAAHLRSSRVSLWS